MAKRKKISESTVPSDFFSVKLKPISRRSAEKLSVAAKCANEKIAHNNQIYSSSNSHASSYATK